MRDRVSRRYREKKSLVGTFGITGLFAYLTGVIQGYIRGFTGDHKMIKRVGRLLLPTTAFVLVCFIIYMSAPILPQLKKEAEIDAAVAQAAEEDIGADIVSEDEGEEDVKPEENEAETEEKETEEETENREEPVPLDNTILEPSDVYAEKGGLAVFQAYYPDAGDYQWEIETESGQWEEASSEMVRERSDELQRKISLLELTADREKAIRCRIRVGHNPEVNYTAALHILSGAVSSISADEFSAEAGKYVNAGEIPVEVTYSDGRQEVITGLSGLYFLDTEESKESSETASGNMQETITTVKTACDYNRLEAGTAEGTLGYRKQDGESLEAPVNLKGLDLTAPVISELQIDDFEVSNVDRPVPVTVSVSASDDVTPTRQLDYAFLPEGLEIQEEDWKKEAVFTAEITKNGIWTAYCRDEAGNVATADQELIVVDNKAPTINISLQYKEEWCRQNTIYVSAEDNLPVEYRYICTASGKDSGWTSESSKGVDANGTWTVQVRDAVGNTAEQGITVDNIDTRAPVIRSITEKTEGEAVINEE